MDARDAIAERGRRLQVVTIAWNSGEFVVAVVAGLLAGSVALVGFGFDSARSAPGSRRSSWAGSA
jgi:acyl-CoA synthetase (AMP-forming)/AMP-acid ligase II